MTIVAETIHAAAPLSDRPEEDSRIAAYCRQMLLWLPLAPVAVGMAGGIVFDRYLPAHWGMYVGAFGLAGVTLVLAYRARGWAAPLAVGALVLASAAVGGLRHQVAFWRLPAGHVMTWVDKAGELARLRGRIVSEPVIRETEPQAYGLPISNKPHTSFLLEAWEILTPQGWAECKGLVRVGVQGPADHVRLGDGVEIYAALRPIDGPRNPGEYDWRLYNRRRGLYVTASVRQPQSIVKLPEAAGGGSLARLIGGFRQGCRRALLDGIVAEEPEAGLLSTYVAGQRSAVSRQINEAFRRSGTAHLLAVSGSHVALIATVGGFVGCLLLGRPRRAALVAFVAVIFFSLLVEANAPALRAAIMGVLAVSGLLLGRPFNSGNWLSASAVVLLAISPADLFSPPFQMTFAAVIALILLTRAICTTLFGPRDLAGWIRLRIQLHHGQSRWYRARLNMRNAFSYSVAAWLANVPLLMWHFGQFNPYGHLATLLVTPLASVTLILGFCKLLLGLAWPSLGHAMAPPVEVLADWMARFAEWLGSWPGASIAVPAPPLWLLMLTYAVLGYWAITARQRWHEAPPIPDRWGPPSGTDGEPAFGQPDQAGIVPVSAPPTPPIYRPIRPRYVVGVAGVLLGLYWLTICLTVPDHLRVHVLSVGDGLCVVVRCPDGKNLLYDCGSISISGVGEKVVVPALQALGVRRIDAAVLSHPNLDHYSGLIDLADAIPIGEVWLGEAFRASATEGMPRQLLRDLKARGVRLNDAAAGTAIPDLGPVSTEVIWPPSDLHLPSRDDNDASVVIRIRLGDRTILLAGDIGQLAQGRLVRDDPRAIRADTLVLPHHGRTKTLDPRFISTVGPQVAIASTATPQRPGQPALVVPPGCHLVDTQTGGMVTVDLPPEGPSVATFAASALTATR